MNAPEKKQYFITSSFHDGLPKTYYPKDATKFSNVDELSGEYQVRKTKLEAMFEAEVAVHKKNEYTAETLRDLETKHKKAAADFENKFRELRTELELHEKELKSSVDKGLR